MNEFLLQCNVSIQGWFEIKWFIVVISNTYSLSEDDRNGQPLISDVYNLNMKEFNDICNIITLV